MKLWSTFLVAVVVAGAQGPKMIVWAPGMGESRQDSALWMKASVPDRAALSVSISSDQRSVAVQIALTNHSSAGIDVLPDRVSLTLSQPQVLPLVYVPAEHSPGRGAF